MARHDDESTGSPGFVRVRRVRSFDDIVEQVRRSIADGAIGAGERLPNERELAEQFGVSRATLREALRALEAVGILEIRLGAHGGAYALEQPGDKLTAALRDLFAAEAVRRPDDTRLFRATFHADNATWARPADADLPALSAAAGEGERSFLLALARSTRIPARYALAETLEMIQIAGAGQLAQATLREILDLLLDERRAEARELLFRTLAGDGALEVPR